MANFLTPVSVLPLNDRPLEDIFTEAIMGITGLPEGMVRPRYQPSPPNQPDFEANWVAFGVNITEQDVFHYDKQVEFEGDSAMVVERDEYMDVLCSFYGADNNQFMSRWRDGLAIEQNRWSLGELGIQLVAIGKQPVNVPALLKGTWARRVDLSCQFSRRVSVTYAVRSIESAEVGIFTDEGLPPQHIIVNPPQ